jgi:hypothetical protein
MKKIGILLTIFFLVLFTFGCSKSPTSTETPELSSDQSSDSNEGTDTDTGTTTGLLQIVLKDNPLENAKHVYVTLDQIRVHRADPGKFIVIYDNTREFDLLRLKRHPQVVVDRQVKAGHYNQIRLSIVSGMIVLDEEGADVTYEMKIPSSEIKIPIQLKLEEDGQTEVVLDFDAEKSIHFHKKGNKNSYTLRPVIKVEKIKNS